MIHYVKKYKLNKRYLLKDNQMLVEHCYITCMYVYTIIILTNNKKIYNNTE